MLHVLLGLRGVGTRGDPFAVCTCLHQPPLIESGLHIGPLAVWRMGLLGSRPRGFWLVTISRSQLLGEGFVAVS